MKIALRMLPALFLCFLLNGRTLCAQDLSYAKISPYGFVKANCATGGITDIYVVNSEWLCVVNDYMTNIWADIVQIDMDTYGGGTTNRHLQSYDAYVAGSKLNYDYWRDVEQMYDWWAPQIRYRYDTPLNTASFFSVTSPDDPAYASALHPTEVGRYINTIKRWIDPLSGFNIPNCCYNVNFSWIRLPSPMVSGRRYTVTLGNGLSGNVLFDERHTISYAFRVNQIGYLNWAPEKYAYLGSWGGTKGPIEMSFVTNQPFHLIDADSGVAVFTNQIALRYDPMPHMPRVSIDGVQAAYVTSFWSRTISLPAENVTTTVTVVVHTDAGAVNQMTTNTYSWSAQSTQSASVENSILPQNNFVNSSPNLEVRVYPEAETIGEYVYQLDFSAFTNSGSYFISVPGVGRSWPFSIGPDVYGEPFYKVMKGMYQQRSGFEVKSNHLAWARPAAHTHTYRSKVCSVDRLWPNAQSVKGSSSIEFFEQAAAEVWKMRHICGETNLTEFRRNPRARPEWIEVLDREYLIPDCYGGWYDAADYDKSIAHFKGMFDLLTTYLMASNSMMDGACNMEESGNGIPDILDEVLWGLRTYRTSQREDGGVSVRFESYGHPGDGYGTNNTAPYFASYPDRFSSLAYSAVAALMSYVVRPYDAAIADDCLQSAEKAYAFSQNPDNRVRNISFWLPEPWEVVYSPAINAVFDAHAPAMLEYQDQPENPQVWLDYGRLSKWQSNPRLFRVAEYRYDEPEDFPYSLGYQMNSYHWYAPFYLYLASGDAAYADIVNKTKDSTGFGRTDSEMNANFIMAILNDPAIDASIRNYCRDYILTESDGFVASIDSHPYRSVVPRPRPWGTSTQQNLTKRLLQAYALSGNSNYLAKAILANDFMLGCRPMGFNFTTGMGLYYVVHFQHGNIEGMQADGILDPSPGFTTYMPTGRRSFYWSWRGYRMAYTRSYDHLGFTGTNVETAEYYLPPPFDRDAGGMSGDNYVPVWHRVQIYQGDSVNTEFTFHETMTSTVLGYGVLLPPHWMPGDDLVNLAPRPKEDIYGVYYMP